MQQAAIRLNPWENAICAVEHLQMGSHYNSFGALTLASESVGMPYRNEGAWLTGDYWRDTSPSDCSSFAIFKGLQAMPHCCLLVAARLGNSNISTAHRSLQHLFTLKHGVLSLAH